MLTDQDRQFLQRAIRHNACVLFLGAGFSADAKNKSGGPIPGGLGLAEELWRWLGYGDLGTPYESTASPLDKLFDIARKKKGDKATLTFLQNLVGVHSYPDWYRTVAYPYWHRIYTTNVDSLVELIFRDVRSTKLDLINAIVQSYRDRDQTLGLLQYVKLNGHLDHGIDHMTFGVRQYGRRAGNYDPWYDHFVRDYATHATILVGTQVNEPLFWRALVSRQGRSGAATELRLKSFLVSPTPSPVVLDSLSEFNVIPVSATAREFFDYVRDLIGDYPKYEEVIIHVNPQLAYFRDRFVGDAKDLEALKVFLGAFTHVIVPPKPSSYRSLYLLGATPQWEDIALGLDAIREVTAEAQTKISEAFAVPQGAAIVVTGYRGAGKSTLLLRVAANLAAAGHLVFHCWGEDVPEAHVLARAIDRLGQRAALFVDDAEWIGGVADKYVSELAKVKYPPVIVLGMRANTLHRIEDGSIPHSEIWLKELTDADIEAVIDVLERENKLGVMTGRPRIDVRRSFKEKAKKQILVAMREITTGLNFDVIIAKEYRDIPDEDVRITYLCACLASAAGASLSRTQLLAASELPPARFLSTLNRELREMLVPVVGSADRVVPRHQVIAETVVDRAPRPELAKAYRALLAVLAHDMDPSARSGEARRWFRLYKRLISHAQVYRLFEKNIEEARAIYDSLTRLLHRDSQYWLQYGSLELEYGELDFASTYLATAESLNSDDWFIQNAKGHLLLALGRASSTLAEAIKLRQEGEELLQYLIDRFGEQSAYPWHTLVSHVMDWLEVWERDTPSLRKELEKLKIKIEEACETHPLEDTLKDLKHRVDKAYLSTAQVQ